MRENKKSITEKTWQHKGLKCKVIFVRQSHRCGYVGVPMGHPLFGKGYNAIYDEGHDLDVHGGLTYSNKLDEIWWFGFDCAHLGDETQDERDLRGELPNLYSEGRDHFWVLDEVVKETEKLAKQLYEIGRGKD